MPALGVALKAAPYILGALRLGRRHGTDWGALRRTSDSYRPSGYLNPEDYTAAEGVRRRLSGAATESAGNLRLEAMRRMRQRNIDIAPASEATLARIGEGEAAGHERAAEGAEEYLGNVRLGNQRFEQQKALSLLGGQIGEAMGGQDRQALRDTTFFNSLLDITPDISSGIDQLLAGRGSATSTLPNNPRYSPDYNQDEGLTDEELGLG